MFLLHETTRAALCRTLFVALGLFPTAGALWWSAAWSGSAQRVELCGELSRRLGLLVECGETLHPLPGETRYLDLIFSDPETRLPLATCPRLDLRQTTDRLSLAAESLELEWTGWQRAKTLLTARLHAGTAPEVPLELLMKQVRLAGVLANGQVLTLYDVAARDDLLERGRGAAAAFRLSPGDAQPTRIRAQRSATADSPGGPLATRWEIQTGDRAVPCGILWGPEAAALAGARAEFRGALWGAESPHGLQAEVRGVWSGIDLNAAVGRPFAQRIGGTAALTCRPLIIRDGKLAAWEGEFSSGPGQWSTGLIRAMAERLKMKPLTAVPKHVVALDDVSLAAAFEWRDGKVIVRGRAANQPTGTVLGTARQPLLAEPAEPLAPHEILSALAPAGTTAIPALPAAARLLEWLPHP